MTDIDTDGKGTDHDVDPGLDYDPARQFFHQISLTVQGATEADIDEEIERRLTKLTENPYDWTVVTKNMRPESMAMSQGGETVLEVLIADVLAMRCAGLVPWKIAKQHDH